nr:unnamed protein product [Callosobruchus analis]
MNTTETQIDRDEILFNKIKEYFKEYMEVQMKKIKEESENLFNFYKQRCDILESELKKLTSALDRAVQLTIEAADKKEKKVQTCTVNSTRVSKANNSNPEINCRTPLKDATSSSSNELKVVNTNTGASEKVPVSVSLYESTQKKLCEKYININQDVVVNNDESDWRVTPRRKRGGNKIKNVIIGTGGDNTEERGCPLKAAPQLSYIHIYNLDPTTTVDQVTNYLKPKYPEVKCEQLASSIEISRQLCIIQSWRSRMSC